MDLSFITSSKTLIADIIQFCAWAVVVYKLFKRPETEQDKKIDTILVKLDNIQKGDIESLRTSIRMLVSRQFMRLCYECINKKYVTLSDLDTVEILYQEYHCKYGMNGRGKDLYEKVLDLPIREVGNVRTDEEHYIGSDSIDC